MGIMMKIGYARVSTNQQDTKLQIDALQSAGCEKIYQDVASGGNTDRPELKQCLKAMNANDVLVVWKLDRLGRSLPHLIEIIHQLERCANMTAKGCSLCALCISSIC